MRKHNFFGRQRASLTSLSKMPFGLHLALFLKSNQKAETEIDHFSSNIVKCRFYTGIHNEALAFIMVMC